VLFQWKQGSHHKPQRSHIFSLWTRGTVVWFSMCGIGMEYTNMTTATLPVCKQCLAHIKKLRQQQPRYTLAGDPFWPQQYRDKSSFYYHFPAELFLWQWRDKLNWWKKPFIWDIEYFNYELTEDEKPLDTDSTTA